MTTPLLLTTPAEMSAWSRERLKAGKSIGFVPTMGALHAGHKSLLDRARKENDMVVASIFVNPTQFGPGEDFERYPRSFEADEHLCAGVPVDVLFHPAPKDMYAADARTFVEVGSLQDVLCGMSRPGHFRGVATVVIKLFALVRPDRAYFGRKDAQQVRILEVMTRDLNLGVQIVPCEIVREADGLAMSSRNRFLAPLERKQAQCLYQALQHCIKRVAAGETAAMKLSGEMAELIDKAAPNAEIDYVAIVDLDTLTDVAKVSGACLAALAVKIGATRLIDNARL